MSAQAALLSGFLILFTAGIFKTLKEKGLEGDNTPERRKKIEVWDLSGFEIEC